MSNPIDAFSDELKKRMEHPFWWSFIISWLLINWKVVYITISLNGKEINDKIEHIEKLYDFWIFGFRNAYLLLFLYPILASAVAVGLIPYFARLYLTAQLYHKKKDNNERVKWIQNEKVLLEKEKELIEEKKDVQNLKSEQDIWDEDYTYLISKYPELINQLTSIIYLSDWWAWGDPELTKLLEVNDLTVISKDKQDSPRHKLTNKWKYFLKKDPIGH